MRHRGAKASLSMAVSTTTNKSSQNRDGEITTNVSQLLKSSDNSNSKKVKKINPSPRESKKSSSFDFWWFDVTLLFGGIFSTYILTLYPTIAGGDSGELLAESCHLGVSHPPGYPLYNMILHIVMQYVPVGVSKAWNANAFAAVCDSLCSVFIYLSVLQWTKNTQFQSRLAAIGASGMFALSPLIWTYAVSAEVFSLNNLFASTLLYLWTRYAQCREWNLVYVGAFVCGMAMCNQHTIILLEIPIILHILCDKRKELTVKKCFTVALCFFCGLLPYIYMPIISSMKPEHGSWGHVTTLEGFWHHLRRADYGTFRLYSSSNQHEDLGTRLNFYFQDLITREGLYVAVPIGVIGILASFQTHPGYSFKEERGNTNPKGSRKTDKALSKRKRQRVCRPETNYTAPFFVLFALAFYLVVFHSLANLPLNQGLLYGVHMRFWQQPNILVFAYVGVGLSKLYYWINMFFSPIVPRNTFPLVITCTLIYIQAWKWWNESDQTESWYLHNYAKALIDSVPKNSFYITNYDLQWTSIRYLQRCEAFRTDVTFINLSMMTYSWFKHKHALYGKLKFPGTHLVRAGGANSNGFTMREFVDANYNTFRKSGIYIGGKLSYNDDEFFEKYQSIPHGLLTKFVKKSSKPSLDKWYWTNHNAMKVVRRYLSKLPNEEKYGEWTWENTVVRDYHMQAVEQATHLLDEVLNKNSSLSLLVEAARPLEYSYRNEPPSFYSDSLLKNLGLAYANIVKSTERFDQLRSEPFEAYVGDKADPKDYAQRASIRMLEVWSDWIERESAAADPGFAQIKAVVHKFRDQYLTKVNKEAR